MLKFPYSKIRDRQILITPLKIVNKVTICQYTSSGPIPEQSNFSASHRISLFLNVVFISLRNTSSKCDSYQKNSTIGPLLVYYQIVTLFTIFKGVIKIYLPRILEYGNFNIKNHNPPKPMSSFFVYLTSQQLHATRKDYRSDKSSGRLSQLLVLSSGNSWQCFLSPKRYCDNSHIDLM